MKVLITGISGLAGQRVAKLLLTRGHTVSGIDKRAWPSAPEEVTVYRADIRKRAAEEAFRQAKPDSVIHMATVTHLSKRSEDRYRINLKGSQAIFEHAERYGAKRLLFVGRHTYYGASPDSPLYHGEDDPPIAMHSFPELSDLVAADMYAGSALWQRPALDTMVLRFCYTLGPDARGTLASFLRPKRVPSIAGYDPLFQVMHDDDVALALATALESKARGVFNVAGPMPLPLSVLIRECGRTRIPIPESLFLLAQGRLGMPRLPPGALAHIKYPVVISDDAFREATGFEHQNNHRSIIDDFKSTCPIKR